jgi:hypothetical protein
MLTTGPQPESDTYSDHFNIIFTPTNIPQEISSFYVSQHNKGTKVEDVPMVV